MLYRNIYLINPQANSLAWLNEARQQFLNVVRRITKSQMESARGQQLVELLQECLSAQTFVVDYQRHYPVEHDIAQLLPRCPSLWVPVHQHILKPNSNLVFLQQKL